MQLQRQALEKNPEDPVRRELLVWTLLTNREVEAAEDVCRVGLGLDPGSLRLVNLLGVVLAHQGKTEAAIAQFQEAIRIDATVYAPYQGWKELLYKAGRYKEAAEKIHEYLRGTHNPSLDVFADLGFIYYDYLNEYDRAFVAWSELFERSGAQWTLGSLVSCLRLTESTPEVTARIDRLIAKLERIPEPRRTARVLNALAALFLYHPEKRNPAKALDYASSAIQRAKVKHPDLLATLAEAKFLTGGKAEAVAILEEAAGLPGAGQLVTDKLKEYLAQITGGPPETPGNLEPHHASPGLTPPVLLAASPFGHPDRGVQHLRTRWQLRASGGGGAPPALDHVSKTDRESWAVPEGLLLPRTTYSWRVSYTGTNLSASSPSAETSFTTADFPWEAVPFDLSGQFNRDVVTNPGDGQDDPLDSGGCRLAVAGFDGERAEDPRVQGLPGDRRIGIHVLGDYTGKNAVQLSSLDRGSIRIPVEPGRYSAVRFLVTGGNGDSLVPLVLEYADGTTEEMSLPCDDWYDDSPTEGKIEIGVLQPGVVPAIDGMDRIDDGFFNDANDPAIFEVVRAARPEKMLRALLLEPGRGLFTQTTGRRTRFNLLAATGIRTIGR